MKKENLASKEVNLTLTSLKYILFITTLFAFSCSKAQTVYSVSSKYDADVKVFVTKSKYDADLIVFKAKSKYDCKDNTGIWFFTDSKYDAKKLVYFVDSKYDADLIIFFSESKYDAEWRNKEKIHLMY